MIMSDLTQTTHDSKSQPTTAAQLKPSVADTIVDFGLVWADKGIGFGKKALENGARALDRTAQCLATYQVRLKGTETAAKAPAGAGANGGESAKITS
jgi:hypothetical protein